MARVLVFNRKFQEICDSIMGIVGEDTWIVAETSSFLCRIFEVMAICCVMLVDKGNSTSSCTSSELLFALSCATVFFVNCFEFIGPPSDNMKAQLFAIGVGLGGTLILMINSDPDPTIDPIYKGKVYASVFSGLSMLTCFITGADFYVHDTGVAIS